MPELLHLRGDAERRRGQERKRERSWSDELKRRPRVAPYSLILKEDAAALGCETGHRKGFAEPIPSPVGPAPTASESHEKKFVRLRDQWKTERGYSSSISKLTMHPAYQMIVGMGPDAIPLLLRELEREVDYWFWALQAITEEDPVPPESRGNWQAMAKSWLAWGEKRGY